MSVQVILTPEEFAEDLDLRLGRANGNIYHRKPGLEGVNDGQVMVRLKKKRFVILDYSIVPTEADIQVANSNPHISIPPGAGKTSCTNADCNKVGVPILLYDSDPTEPSSLYMRSGLCFTCQRNLNEKRRTQRKRPSDAGAANNTANAVFPAIPGSKKYKLSSDSIVITPVDGIKRHGDGYGFSEIGADLQAIVHDVLNDTNRLVNAVSSSTEPAPGADIAATAAALAASDAATHGVTADGLLPDAAANGKVHEPAATTSEDINVLYDKAFMSMNKAIFLLTQWKHSWDAAIAAAVAQETVTDHGLAEAVASAAAVAAAASEGQNSNVASLLLAANGKKDDGKKEDEEVEVKVEAFEV
jgi:hypothetical protein